MRKSNKNVSPEPPKNFWERDLKFNAMEVFSGLAEATTHIIKLEPEELINTAVKIGSAIGLESSKEEIAFNLISKSLLDSLINITNESASHFRKEEALNPSLSNAIAKKLRSIKVTINKDFFRNPGGSRFLQSIENTYKDWLQENGVDEISADCISKRLPSYFVYSIASEWSKDPTTYNTLTDSVASPFDDAEEIESGWHLYQSYLKKRVNESIFDEPFSLCQLYVPLNAYYKSKPEKDGGTAGSQDPRQDKHCVDLAQELKSWIKSSDKTDALRIISGGPGSGKSSFTKMFCCEVVNDGIAHPIYIPLHLIDPTREIASEVERFTRDEGLLEDNPLDKRINTKKILLVFDGLDELASTGKSAAQVAKNFVQAVDRMIERRNLGQNPIFSIISGREIIVQENETEFRKHKQLLTILPYHVSRHEKTTYYDPQKILNKDLRQLWWKNYGKLTGKNYPGLPEALKKFEIDEITAQPLLNYLVALSYKRGKLEFAKGVNLNNVYADLVGAVYERGYENSRAYAPISHISYRDFTRVLEEIGLAAWHGSDGRSTSVRDIMRHCKQSGIAALLSTFTEGAEAGVTKLLAAFFFRRNGDNIGEDATFVFTHKSFGEYLTASRICRGLERIVKDRQRRLESLDDGSDIIEALSSWLKLTGPAPLTRYIQNFLLREISNKTRQELELWHKILTELTSHAIERMMPCETLGNLNFQTSTMYDTNASTTLFIALNCCSTTLGKVADIKLDSTTAFGNFIRRVCPQRDGPRSPLIFDSLSYINLSKQCYDMGDLYDADLSHTVWRNGDIHFANFSRAVIRNTDFSDSKISGARFDMASISSSNFTNTNLSRCLFNDCKIENTNFHTSQLNQCTFNNTTLRNCTLDGAVMHNQIAPPAFAGCSLDYVEIDDEDVEWFEQQVKEGNISGTPLLISDMQDEDEDED